MPNITGARAYVARPTPQKVAGGIYSTSDVREVSGHELLGAEYETHLCDLAQVWEENCGNFPNTICTTGNTFVSKAFDGLGMVTGDPFSVYKGIECNLMGHSMAEYDSLAKEALDLLEQRMVENTIALRVHADGDAIANPSDQIGFALGELELWLAANYAGQGVIHIGPYGALAAVSEGFLLQGVDGSLMTPLGTPVSVEQGCSYAGAGLFLWASGQVTILRGPVESFAVPEQNYPDGNCKPPRALAERTIVPLIDCGAAWTTAVMCKCTTDITP